jgi:hypothetical protein
MATAAPASRNPFSLLAVGLLVAIGTGAAGYELAGLRQAVEELQQGLRQRDATLQEMHGEITRLRLEQTTGQPGVRGLMRRLEQFAPLTSNARVTDPDYQAAKQEMQAILRAFATLGADAWDPVVQRLQQLDPQQQFEQVKSLLEATVAIDKARGIELFRDALLGLKFPSPRLRWYTAQRLIELDKPLAQNLLRQILTTESSRGPDLERAKAYGLSVPDRAALATSGFDTFVNYYVASEDAEIDATLLMVLGRTEHDTITIQTCVEALGNRRCQLAIEPIQQLCRTPPGGIDNPIFLVKCLDALDAIQGRQARPFLEQMLTQTNNPRVADHLKSLLAKS